MITEKTVFVVCDREFDTREEAEHHEAYCTALDNASAILRTPIESIGYGFSDGEGYVQQSSEAVSRFIIAVGEAIALYDSPEIAQRWKEQPRGIVGRFMDDSNSPARSVYWRLSRIDEDFREWGQMFFALHPSEGKQVEWPNVIEPAEAPIA